MILGAVLAGGMSRRFGSDKALVDYEGSTLLARAVDTLSGWCEHVVVVGRAAAPAPTLPDWPRAGLGPLGGLAAALRLAGDRGYAAVLSCGVDSLNLPDNLAELLTPAPACLRDQPVVGLWPSASLPAIEALLSSPARHSVYGFAELIGARLVETSVPTANVNTPDDLATFRRQQDT